MPNIDEQQALYDAFIDSLSDEELEEYYQDMEADRIIDEQKSNPIEY